MMVPIQYYLTIIQSLQERFYNSRSVRNLEQLHNEQDTNSNHHQKNLNHVLNFLLFFKFPLQIHPTATDQEFKNSRKRRYYSLWKVIDGSSRVLQHLPIAFPLS